MCVDTHYTCIEQEHREQSRLDFINLNQKQYASKGCSTNQVYDIFFAMSKHIHKCSLNRSTFDMIS